MCEDSSLSIGNVTDIIQAAAIVITTLIIYVTAFYAKDSLNAQSYVKVTSDLNSKINSDEVAELKDSLKLSGGVDWSDPEKKLARSITNRYQIIAHIVERRLIDYDIFIENFSGTFLDVYTTCLPYILERRLLYQKTDYLRRDLEVLGLKSWLYQIKVVGYKIETKIIKSDFTLDKLDPYNALDLIRAEERIKILKRKRSFKDKVKRALFIS